MSRWVTAGDSLSIALRAGTGIPVCLSLLLSTMVPAHCAVESLWGAKEFHTRGTGLRYLMLFPPNYDPDGQHELWVNLHGSPGCASHAIFQYREESAARGA